jgi:rhomboid protease GluP
MIEERLEQALTNLGYRRMNSNNASIYLFYHMAATELTVISVIHSIAGMEMTKEQYMHILEQIKNNLRREPSPGSIRLLSLLLTPEVERVKHLCIDKQEDQHWIIDLSSNRLIIYETGSKEFTPIRDLIEGILSEEELKRITNQETTYTGIQTDAGCRTGQARTVMLKRGFRLFTFSNTIIILLNVIAFILLHYTPSFGGKGSMLGRGALSWYYVFREREYYRVLTSMFMHSDLEHLFNNMLVLYFVGDNLERATGKWKYLFLYFGTGILAGLTSISYNMWKEGGQYLVENSVFSIGASGAIFGVVGAMLFIVIINRGRMEDISTRQMVLFALFSLYGGIANTQIDQAAHVGGFLAGILLAAIIYRRPRRSSREEPLY